MGVSGQGGAMRQGRCLRQMPPERGASSPSRPPLELVVTPRDDESRPSVGRILLEQGAISGEALMRAVHLQSRHAGSLGDILIAHGLASEAQVAAALSQRYQTAFLTRDSPAPDPRLIDRLGIATCLELRCLPWSRAGDVTLIACAQPALFEQHRPRLTALFGPVAMALITVSDLHAMVLRTRRNRLKLWAETCVDAAESCRSFPAQDRPWRVWAAGVGALALMLLAPHATLLALTVLTTMVLALVTALKFAATIAAMRARTATHTPPSLVRQRKPVVSILVPLYREPEVVPRLLNRLSRLTWPRELLDILLVVEEHDHATSAALAAQPLPRWVRVIPVPEAPLKTKPRALNFAMLFARGAIIGVYDAEDAPAPDQIHRVVECFQSGPPGRRNSPVCRGCWISTMRGPAG